MSSAFQHFRRWAFAFTSLAALASCGGSDDVVTTALPQTILFEAPAAQTFGASTLPPLVASSTAGLVVSFSSSTPTVCTVSGTALSLTGAGTCTITAEQPGNLEFAAAAPVVRSFVVAAAAQAITFVSPGKQKLGTPPAALVATSTSGLAVSFASSTPDVCTINGAVLSLVSAGNCTVTASQAGNTNYMPAVSVSHAFEVEALLRAQRIDYPSPGNQTLGSAPAPLTATSTSGLAVTFTSLTPSICTVSGSTLTLVSAGVCTTAASQPGNVDYAAAEAVMQSVTVSAAAQTISFAGPGNQTLGSPPPTLSATATSGLPVTFSSTTPAVCTVSGTTLTLVTVGNCTISANQAGGGIHAEAATVTRSVIVAAAPRAAQTITFASPGNQTLGAPPATLDATASSGLPVFLASTTASVCTVSGNTLTLVAAGTCIIDASQAGDATYAAAPTVSRVFSVAAAPLLPQSITFAGPGNQTLGSPPPSLVATASSGLPVSFASTTPSTCTVSASTLTLVAAGTCIIDASQAGNATYAAATTVSRVFSVAAAPLLPQSITFAGPGNQTLGSPPPALVATASSGLPVSFASTTPSTCTVSGSTLTLVAAGTCIIDASQAGNATYAAAPTVSRVLSVAAAPLLPQSISFAGPGNQTLGSPPPSLVATATSGLPVSFASTTPSTCTVSGNTLTLVAAGTCIIDASQAGDASFAAATTVSRVLTVSTAAQSITFTSPGNQTLGSPTAPLVASASSGLPVSFASTTPSVCTVSGTTLTLVAAGTCSIDASQAGNATYAPAPTVTRSVLVSAAPLLPQSITFAGPGNQTLGSPPLSLVASATSGLPVSFASSTPGTCTVSGSTLTLVAAGTCIIDASQAGDATFAAATTISRAITVSPAAQSISFTSPGNQTLGNPTSPLVASASSGLPVSFASTTPGVCTVSGTTLTLVAAGTCSIDASQAGNATYAAAPTVTVSFTVAVELFANGGFETAGATTPAEAWLAAASGYTLSNQGRTGSSAAQLSSTQFSAAVMLQNSVEQGNRPPLTVGTSPTLTFWAKGFAGTTGNVLFAIRYLDGTGNIKANSQNQFFQGLINPNTWTKITFNLGPVPAGSLAAFIEFSQAIGPIDPANGMLAGTVLIDDVSLQ